MRINLTQLYLKECLTYHKDSGLFIWNARPYSHFKYAWDCDNWNARYSKKEAGTVSEKYLIISIKNARYKAHRLAFLYVEGFFPENNVDHVDGDELNNRWNNLREASSRCNAQNRKLAKNNTSGVTGVTFNKKANRWAAQIVVAGKPKSLGYYPSFDAACAARYKKEISDPNWTCSVESTSFKYLKEKNMI